MGRAWQVLLAASAAVLVIVGLIVVLDRTGGDGGAGRDDTPGPPPKRETPAASDAPARGDLMVIAHRGASAYAPHDTVAAAREAVERGADALEVDVRQTRDDHLVALFHPTLAPTTNVEQVFPGRAPWRVESFTLGEIRRLDAGSWFSPGFSGERVPTLAEITNAVAGSGVRVVVEVKSPDRYPGIADRLLRELRGSPDRYLEVESFDAGFLRRFSLRSPPVQLGLAGTPPVERLEELTSYLAAVNPSLASIDASYVDRAHDLGLGVKVWSVNEASGVRRATELGVDAIYTHRPDLARDVMAGSRTTRSRFGRGSRPLGVLPTR